MCGDPHTTFASRTALARSRPGDWSSAGKSGTGSSKGGKIQQVAAGCAQRAVIVAGALEVEVGEPEQARSCYARCSPAVAASRCGGLSAVADCPLASVRGGEDPAMRNSMPTSLRSRSQVMPCGDSGAPQPRNCRCPSTIGLTRHARGRLSELIPCWGYCTPVTWRAARCVRARHSGLPTLRRCRFAGRGG